MKTAVRVLDGPTAADSMALVLTERTRRPAVDLRASAPLKVLAPIDLSNGAEAAVEYAADFARAIDAQLTLLHVTDDNSARSEWPPPALDKALSDDVRRVTVPGEVARTICGVAEDFDFAIILMTCVKHRRWTPLWERSVITSVLDSTSRPVLIASSADADSRFRSRRILCVLNLDGTDEPAVTGAEALAQRTGGELILVNAVPEISEGLYWEALFKPSRPLSTGLAARRLHGIGQRLSVPYKSWVSTHSPHRGVDLAARAHAPDLVVATRGTLNLREIGRRVRRPILSVAWARSQTGSYRNNILSR